MQLGAGLTELHAEEAGIAYLKFFSNQIIEANIAGNKVATKIAVMKLMAAAVVKRLNNLCFDKGNFPIGLTVETGSIFAGIGKIAITFDALSGAH